MCQSIGRDSGHYLCTINYALNVVTALPIILCVGIGAVSGVINNEIEWALAYLQNRRRRPSSCQSIIPSPPVFMQIYLGIALESGPNDKRKVSGFIGNGESV